MCDLYKVAIKVLMHVLNKKYLHDNIHVKGANYCNLLATYVWYESKKFLGYALVAYVLLNRKPEHM